MKLHLGPTSFVAALALAAGSVGCSNAQDCLVGTDCSATPTSPTTPTTPTTPTPPDPKKCGGRVYTGMGGVELSASRKAVLAGVDHGRVKPYSALTGEYPRVLGNTPASLQAAAATFGSAPARWYEEPESSSVALQTAYAVSFDGCLTYTQSDAKFAAAPTAQSAQQVCTEMERKFWSRTPTTQEVAACVDVATNGTNAEPQPRRKWAYACASVMTAAGFLTY
jgi:hypothetical protein